jgi:D-beta-D-heptose 7-phosphate kinase/D-beta-D-heptose 1-phosphate adenosyltransferase
MSYSTDNLRDDHWDFYSGLPSPKAYEKNKARVWVNGTFDVLHRGHLEMLEFASTFGILRVGIDYDKRVKQLKGNERPFNSWEDRKYFMSRIVGVNDIVGFGSQEELELRIQEWSPNYLIVGSDYKDKEVIGSQYAETVIFFDKIEGFSSTKILEYGKDISNR